MNRLVSYIVFFVAVVGALCAAPAQAWARSARQLAEPSRLEVPGHADAFYYRPRGRGLRPVLMYLHGRGGNPAEDCRKWARVGTQFGWVVCPQGPEDRGGGSRAWSNNPQVAQEVMHATLVALRDQYKGRVQLRDNILIGFSEGAFIAMQVGLHDPKTYNRWLILAANDQYWWGDTEQLLAQDRRKIRRIFLLTGENDEVAGNTERVGEILKKAKIPSRVKIVPGLGHEIPQDRMVTTYRRPLLWLAAAR